MKEGKKEVEGNTEQQVDDHSSVMTSDHFLNSIFRIWFSAAVIGKAWQFLFCAGRIYVLHRKKVGVSIKRIRSMILDLSITTFSHRLKP